MENIMTNTRPLEDAERQLFNLVHDISNISRIFKATDPEVARIISRAYSKMLGLRYATEDTDEGDRYLINCYGDELAKVAKALQSV